MEPPDAVLIIGGSLAGLMHALVLLSLSRPPKNITILERSPTALLHNQGAGIVAGPEVQQFFSEYVRPGREIAVTSKLRHYLKKDGGVKEGSVEERQQRMTSWDLLYHLLRWRVEGLRSRYVEGLEGDRRGKARYENGCTVTDVEEVEKGVRVTWQQKDAEVKSEVVDLVIAADGASSTIRRLLKPEVERKYCGYVAWRGTVPESELSEGAKGVFVEKFTFYHSTGTQALGYIIPGKEGTMEPGERLFNWVWYVNYHDGSAELEELMTDTKGKRHAITLPVGLMQPQVWEKQKDYAANVLPLPFAEAVAKTKQPFIQAITDLISPENNFFDGRLFLVGDALAGFRPHTAASTGQAAFDALQLGKLYRGEMSKQDYDSAVLECAARVQKSGVVMGQRSQFGHHPLAN